MQLYRGPAAIYTKDKSSSIEGGVALVTTHNLSARLEFREFFIHCGHTAYRTHIALIPLADSR